REAEMAPHGIENEETATALREELTKLPSETTAVLAMYHLEGRPVADIAAQTGLSQNACMLRLSRGREQLRERLERRGIALASITLLAGQLDELFGSARAWAAEIEPAVTEELSRAAL